MPCTPQVRQGGSQASPFIEDLKKAEEDAQAAGVGVYTKVRGAAAQLSCVPAPGRWGVARPAMGLRWRRWGDTPSSPPAGCGPHAAAAAQDAAALAAAVRPAPSGDFDAQSLLSSTGKGRPVAGIVEAVLNGGTLRVTLLPDLTPATITLCGEWPAGGPGACGGGPGAAPQCCRWCA